MKNKSTLTIALWLGFALLVWEVVASYAGISELLLPSPQAVLIALYTGIVKGQLALQVLQSIYWVLLGLITAMAIATFLAIVSNTLPFFKVPIDLLASALHPLPAIALLPLIVLWLGIGYKAVFFSVVHAVVWSTYLILMASFKQIPKEIVEEATMEGASKLKLTLFILLPLCSSDFATALGLGWSRGWRAIISAEMLFGAVSSSGGIGWFLYERRAFMDTAGVYAGVIAVIVIGIIADYIGKQIIERGKS